MTYSCYERRDRADDFQEPADYDVYVEEYFPSRAPKQAEKFVRAISKNYPVAHGGLF